MICREKDGIDTQYQRLQNLHDKLSSDTEHLRNDRDAMRRETRELRKEVTENQQFVDKLQREKREINKELENAVRDRAELESISNNNRAGDVEDNSRLREANSRLTVSYSKLKELIQIL